MLTCSNTIIERAIKPFRFLGELNTMSKQDKIFDRNKAITSIVKNELGSDRSRVLVNDDFKADGVKPTWFNTPPKDAIQKWSKFFEETKKAIFMGFPPEVRKLLNMPIKEVPAGNGVGQSGIVKLPDDGSGKIKYAPAGHGTRKYWQQQISTKMNQFKTSYLKYLGIKGKKGADQNRQTDLQKICKAFVALQNLIEKSDGVKDLDLVETSEHLKDSPIMALLTKK